MPPPTRMNMASSAAPKPKPSSTSGAFARYSSTTTAAPNNPRPTVNIPATPPVRNAIRNALRSPPSRAAAATRTLPRTVSDMPVNPVSPENKAPTRKKMLRPHITPAPPAWGSTSSTKKMTTTNTPRVLNWRRRYAAAPSCTARAISCIFWVPWPAASTSRTSTPAVPRASTPTTATMTTQVRLEPLTLTGFAASAGTSLDIRPPGTPNGRCADRQETVGGSLRRPGPNHEHRAIPNSNVTPSLPLRDASVTAADSAAGGGAPGPVDSSPVASCRRQAVSEVDGQLIWTLTPELVDTTS